MALEDTDNHLTAAQVSEDEVSLWDILAGILIIWEAYAKRILFFTLLFAFLGGFWGVKSVSHHAVSAFRVTGNFLPSSDVFLTLAKSSKVVDALIAKTHNPELQKIFKDNPFAARKKLLSSLEIKNKKEVFQISVTSEDKDEALRIAKIWPSLLVKELNLRYYSDEERIRLLRSSLLGAKQGLHRLESKGKKVDLAPRDRKQLEDFAFKKARLFMLGHFSPLNTKLSMKALQNALIKSGAMAFINRMNGALSNEGHYFRLSYQKFLALLLTQQLLENTSALTQVAYLESIDEASIEPSLGVTKMLLGGLVVGALVGLFSALLAFYLLTAFRTALKGNIKLREAVDKFSFFGTK